MTEDEMVGWHPEFTQTYVYQVSDAIQPSHPLSSPSPPAPNPSQYETIEDQGLPKQVSEGKKKKVGAITLQKLR